VKAEFTSTIARSGARNVGCATIPRKVSIGAT